MKTISYLRVSTVDQNNGKFKADVLEFANTRNLGQVEFVEETVSGKKSWKQRKIGKIIANLEEGDNLIVPELSRLSRSLMDILEILKIASEKGISVYAVKESLELSDNNPFNKAMVSMLGIISQLERDLISLRTKEALKAKKNGGAKLGRPKGKGKSKLDDHKEEILALIANGSTKKFVAERYDTSPQNLAKWLKHHQG